MSKTMDAKLQEQIDAPAKRRAKEEAEANTALNKFMSGLDAAIERQEGKERVWKIIAGIFGVIVFCLGVYSLGIYIATSG